MLGSDVFALQTNLTLTFYTSQTFATYIYVNLRVLIQIILYFVIAFLNFIPTNFIVFKKRKHLFCNLYANKQLM